jgi:hypothetical protein|tara:strand:- start:296 stop:475 length:180 start_codon:yes stop_codon:yes gene_type:complete
MKLTTKETLVKLNEEGYKTSSSFNNKIYTVNTELNGVRYVRTGKSFEQCIKSIYHDIKR